MLSAQAASAPAPAAAPELEGCPVQKFTKKVDKPLIDAQKARNDKKWEEVLAKVTEAEAIPVEKNLYDQYWIHEFRGIAYVSLKKFPEALTELTHSFESPCMAPADKSARGKLLIQIAFEIKDYPKAIEISKKVLPINSDAGELLATAYYLNNDFPNAKLATAAEIKRLEDSGKVPKEETYRVLQSACFNIKDMECVTAQTEKLVTHYPTPAYWNELINSLLRVSGNEKELLNILRLSDGTGVMKDAPHFTEMAQLALGQGLPGEAQAIIEKGQTKGAFTAQRDKDHATRLLAEAKQAVALDKSTLDKQDASARAKTTGDSDVKLGAAYLSYGENEKAIEALKRGIGKGGVKSPDEAGLLLGIAYMRTNNKTEAAKAFRTVTQNAGLKRIAKMWLINAGEAGTAG
jgi:tetratricopeptide (TPR) repeat protein